MKQRVITGALLIVLLVVLLWLPGWCMSLAALIAIGFATWEEYHALTLAGHRVVSWPAWVVLVGSVPLALTLGNATLVPLMGVALLLMSVQVLFRQQPELTDLAMSALPILTVVLPGLSMVFLSLADQKAVEVVLMALVFTVPLLGDTFALFIGSAIGGKKLCPAVSPHKTVAGALGGLLGSVIGAMAVCGIAALVCNEPTLAKLPPWPSYLMLGLLGGMVGQIGDLFASLVKRHSGIKDFSNLFPGHGGMLDRLDSVLFMAVLVYCYRLFMV
ncbi:MAG: phosphatidate cytidylyltransferase [Clostridia bacterium]|nr:phosphatidate cytidylyltransferase [Clostridia bacterium]